MTFSPYATFSFVHKRLLGIIPNIKEYSDRLNFRCPVCGDSKTVKTKTRGNLYKKNCMYHCFNCGCHTNGLFFLSKISHTSYSQIKLDFFKEFGVQSILGKNEAKTEKPKLTMFDDAHVQTVEQLLSEYSYNLPEIAGEFLSSRVIYDAPYLSEDFRFMWDAKTNRLIIPWQYDGRNVFFQKRAMGNEQPKYLFPRIDNVPLFGLDHVHDSIPYIFITESAIDSIFVLNGVSSGSTTLSLYQKGILKKLYPNHEVIYMFDNPFADVSSRTKVIKLAKTLPSSRFFIPPPELRKFKDPSRTCKELGVDVYTNINFLLENTVTSGKLLASLLLKICG